MIHPVITRALKASDWGYIEKLFGTRGACGGCWCMFWRVSKGGSNWDEVKGEGNRRAFKALLEAGEVQGVLAFDGDAPLAWLSIGPKQDFSYFERSRVFKTLASPENTWAITCFYILPGYRGRGVAGRLLMGAKEVARASGAKWLEGYPTEPRDKDKPIPAAFAHTGVPRIFEIAGFDQVVRLGREGCRPVFRLSL